MRNTATSSRRSSSSSAARSPNGTRSKPGKSGWKRSVNSGQPFAESAPSVRPWKPWSHETTRVRFVAARPSLSAASTASVPLLVKRQRSIRPPASPISSSARMEGIGKLILRATVGGYFVGHGLQKLTGRFGGAGLDGTGRFFESVGLRPGRESALLAGAAETGGGALLTLGLFTPAAASALA